MSPVRTPPPGASSGRYQSAKCGTAGHDHGRTHPVIQTGHQSPRTSRRNRARRPRRASGPRLGRRDERGRARPGRSIDLVDHCLAVLDGRRRRGSSTGTACCGQQRHDAAAPPARSASWRNSVRLPSGSLVAYQCRNRTAGYGPGPSGTTSSADTVRPARNSVGHVADRGPALRLRAHQLEGSLRRRILECGACPGDVHRRNWPLRGGCRGRRRRDRRRCGRARARGRRGRDRPRHRQAPASRRRRPARSSPELQPHGHPTAGHRLRPAGSRRETVEPLRLPRQLGPCRSNTQIDPAAAVSCPDTSGKQVCDGRQHGGGRGLRHVRPSTGS